LIAGLSEANSQVVAIMGEYEQAGTTTQADMGGLWATIREAVRGSQRDLTEGSIRKAIFLLAVPMVMEMAMESVFAVVDVFFVSKLGPDAVAAVGITESMITIIYAVAAGLSMSAAAMVARRIGEKDPQRAALTAVQAISLGLIVACLLGTAGGILAPRLLEFMGAPPSVVRTGSGYTTVMFSGNATILLIFLINAVFRGAGDAAIAMRVLWTANTINILLNPCLIFGLGPFPALGVTGSAVATNIGRGTGVLLQLFLLIRGQGRIAIRREHLHLEPAVMLRLLRLSANGILQVLVATASWVGLVRILTGFGSAVVAGYTIGMRIIVFALLPSWGLGNAAATMVGQNLGAQKPERAERSVWIAAFYNMGFLGAVGVVFVIFAEPIIRLFTQDPRIIPYGVACLRFVSYGFLFYANGMVMSQAFNGAGDTFTPTMMNLFCFWLWEIPLAYTLAYRLEFGPRGVFAAITVAFSTLAVVGILLFRRGNWKKRKV
jgi:putative MATE family efflux protein